MSKESTRYIAKSLVAMLLAVVLVTASRADTHTPPVLDAPLIVGQKAISGVADSSAAYVTVDVYDRGQCTDLSTLAGCVVKASAQVNPTAGSYRFVGLLTAPGGGEYQLSSGDVVIVKETFWPKTPGTPADADQSSVPVFVVDQSVVESPVAWGNVTPTFSTGFILSQNNGQFSQYNLFIGLTVDNSWHVGATHRLDAFTQAQLTSIPATSCTSSTSSQGTSSSTGSSVSSCVDLNAALNSFISSPKAAVVQGGIFFPMSRPSWKWSYNGDSNEFFVAPIIKGGFQSATSTVQTTTNAPGSSSTSATLNQQGLYRNLSYGVRFGQYKLSNSWNIAPLLLTHVDFTIGKWSNFDQCRSNGCTTDAQGNLTNLIHPWLLGVEGHLKIPSTPFYAAFNTITPITGARLSDFRLTFGMEVDIACLIGAISAQQKLNSSGSCDKTQTSAAAKK